MAWSVAEATFPHEEVARALVSLVNELALRAEAKRALESSEPELLMRQVISV